MAENEKTKEELLAEVNELKLRLLESEETLNAIQSGEVDALVVSGPEGDQIYSLKGSDRAYRTLIEGMHEGAAILMPDKTVFYCNNSLGRILKIPIEKIMGKTIDRFISSKDFQIYESIISMGLKGYGSGEITLKKCDGNYIPVYISVQNLEVDNFEGISIIITDLTEQKRTEDLEILNEELKATTKELQAANKEIIQSQKLLQDIINGYPSIIFVKDLKGRFIIVNNKLEQLLGISKEELKGKTDYDVFSKEEAEYYRAHDRRVLEEGRAIPIEEEADLIDGNHTFLANKFPLYDINGNPYGVGSISADITEIKKLEGELRKSRDHLEEKVEERAAEIEDAYQTLKENEIKLKDAITELERSNEELQSFAYITSHDLQEPLRNIASFAQLLQRRYKGQLDSDADDFIDFMVEGAIRMKGMIQGLLEYSRINRARTEFVKVNMNDMLERAITNLHFVINEFSAEITHDTLPDVNADPNQMISVFQNLISNAIKFKKPQLPPRIHISVKIDKNKREWIFSVEDNGIGMETEYIDRIFKVFKRLHTIGEYEGTGIGLAIVKRIIENHGGRIWVESEYGVGSVFYFTLPFDGD